MVKPTYLYQTQVGNTVGHACLRLAPDVVSTNAVLEDVFNLEFMKTELKKYGCCICKQQTGRHHAGYMVVRCERVCV